MNFWYLKQLQRIVFRNTRRRGNFSGGHRVYNKLRWAFLWTWRRHDSKIITFTRVWKIGLTKKVVVHRTLLIIIRDVVCCRAGGMVGLLARGIEHKARGGRTQNIDFEQDDREAGRGHMEQETAPRRFFLHVALSANLSPFTLASRNINKAIYAGGVNALLYIEFGWL